MVECLVVRWADLMVAKMVWMLVVRMVVHWVERWVDGKDTMKGI